MMIKIITLITYVKIDELIPLSSIFIKLLITTQKYIFIY